MAIISKMNPRLADMIAAGEVVDRPSSVLKELIENAIDAHATQIDISVQEIGMKEIKVSDNGIGMDDVDAKLAFERHATSKVKSEGDLSHIHTLGFRGEALAAISAVSQITMITKTNEMQEGFQVVIEAGHIKESQSCAANQGTTISVRQLFFNTPARFKYIKSEYAERYAIIDVFDRLALANPTIAMRLWIDDKRVKETIGNGDMKQLIAAIYGHKIIENSFDFSQSVQKIKIEGYLMNPKIVRSRKKDMSIFINGRYIKNYKLTQAIIDGYHSFLMVGKYPIAIVYLTMDPSLLDVNVHPQKLEVRLVNESLLAYHIEKFVKHTLMDQPHPIRETLPEINQFPETYQPQSLFAEEEIVSFDHLKTTPEKLPYLEYVGTYAGTYLLFQNESGLYLVDQHAAAERVRYEHYYEALAHPVFAVKHELIPLTLHLTSKDLTTIKQYEELFLKYGFHFKKGMLTGRPTWLREKEIDTAIEAMIDMLNETGHIDLKKLRDALAKDVSCKGAIKANQSLSRHEIDHLMEDLNHCKNPYACPHGRPTLIKLSEKDIEKMFKRIV